MQSFFFFQLRKTDDSEAYKSEEEYDIHCMRYVNFCHQDVRIVGLRVRSLEIPKAVTLEAITQSHAFFSPRNLDVLSF